MGINPGKAFLNGDFLSPEWTEAVYEARNDHVRALLDAGISAGQPLDRRRINPLNSISEIDYPSDRQMWNHGETARLLISGGASLHIPDIVGFLPAHIALFSSNPHVAKEIVLQTLSDEGEWDITPSLRPKIREYFAIALDETRERKYACLQRNLRLIAEVVRTHDFDKMKSDDRAFWVSPTIPPYDALPKAPQSLRDQFMKVRRAYQANPEGKLLEAELDNFRYMQRLCIRAMKP